MRGCFRECIVLADDDLCFLPDFDAPTPGEFLQLPTGENIRLFDYIGTQRDKYKRVSTGTGTQQDFL
jgi:hypothetical protein